MHFRFKCRPEDITWSRPDSKIAPFCSTCRKHIPPDTVPLMIWDSKSACAQFCDECVEKYVEVVE